MYKAKHILCAGLIASSAFFSTATTVSTTVSVCPASSSSVCSAFSASDEKTDTPLFYRPETDDPTVQFPLVVVDSPEAYKTWCDISAENDEPFAVVAPTHDMPAADFLKYITGMTENFEVDSERVYLVVNDANSPFVSDLAKSGLFATQITVDYTAPISAETVANLLAAIHTTE